MRTTESKARWRGVLLRGLACMVQDACSGVAWLVFCCWVLVPLLAWRLAQVVHERFGFLTAREVQLVVWGAGLGGVFVAIGALLWFLVGDPLVVDAVEWMRERIGWEVRDG